MTTRLSPHFTLEEALVSQTADREGIDNTPTPEHLENLRKSAAEMEKVRTLLGDVPILVSSGYRSDALNKAVGGSKSSAHRKGLAWDFIAPSYGSNYEVAVAIQESDLSFDQLILEYGWIHISFDTPPRREVLTKKSKTAPWQRGLVA